MSTHEAGTVREASGVREAGASETSSAREEILARVRTALTDLTPEQRAAEVPWKYKRATRTTGVLDLFVERVKDYKADVVRVAAADVPDAVARALTSRGAGSVVVVAHDPGMTVLAERLSGGGIGHMPTCAVATFRWGTADWDVATSLDPDEWTFDAPGR